MLDLRGTLAQDLAKHLPGLFAQLRHVMIALFFSPTPDCGKIAILLEEPGMAAPVNGVPMGKSGQLTEAQGWIRIHRMQIRLRRGRCNQRNEGLFGRIAWRGGGSA